MNTWSRSGDEGKKDSCPYREQNSYRPLSRFVTVYWRFFLARWQNCEKNNRKLRRVCLSVRPHETIRRPVDGFSRNFILENIPKICGENSSLFLKSDENKGHKTYVQLNRVLLSQNTTIFLLSLFKLTTCFGPCTGPSSGSSA